MIHDPSTDPAKVMRFIMVFQELVFHLVPAGFAATDTHSKLIWYPALDTGSGPKAWKLLGTIGTGGEGDQRHWLHIFLDDHVSTCRKSDGPLDFPIYAGKRGLRRNQLKSAEQVGRCSFLMPGDDCHDWFRPLVEQRHGKDSMRTMRALRINAGLDMQL